MSRAPVTESLYQPQNYTSNINIDNNQNQDNYLQSQPNPFSDFSSSSSLSSSSSSSPSSLSKKTSITSTASSVPKESKEGREKSKMAAKERRQKENEQFEELARLLPIMNPVLHTGTNHYTPPPVNPSQHPHHQQQQQNGGGPAMGATTSSLDKASVIRLTTAYLKLLQIYENGLGHPWGEPHSPAQETDRRQWSKLSLGEQGMGINKSLEGNFLFIIAPDGKVVYISEGMAQVLAIDQKEFIGTDVFNYIHQDDCEEFASLLAMPAEHIHRPETMDTKNLVSNKMGLGAEAAAAVAAIKVKNEPPVIGQDENHKTTEDAGVVKGKRVGGRRGGGGKAATAAVANDRQRRGHVSIGRPSTTPSPQLLINNSSHEIIETLTINGNSPSSSPSSSISSMTVAAAAPAAATSMATPHHHSHIGHPYLLRPGEEGPQEILARACDPLKIHSRDTAAARDLFRHDHLNLEALSSEVLKIPRSCQLRLRSVHAKRSAGLVREAYKDGHKETFKMVYVHGYLRIAHQLSPDQCYEPLGLVAFAHVVPYPYTDIRLTEHMFMFRANTDLKIYYIDKDNDLNSSFEHLTAYSATKVAQQLTSFYKFIHPLDLPMFLQAHKQLGRRYHRRPAAPGEMDPPEEGKAQVATKYYRFLHREGGWVWMQTHLYRVTNPRTEPPEWVVGVNFTLSGRECGDLIVDAIQLDDQYLSNSSHGQAKAANGTVQIGKESNERVPKSMKKGGHQQDSKKVTFECLNDLSGRSPVPLISGDDEQSIVFKDPLNRLESQSMQTNNLNGPTNGSADKTTDKFMALKAQKGRKRGAGGGGGGGGGSNNKCNKSNGPKSSAKTSSPKKATKGPSPLEIGTISALSPFAHECIFTPSIPNGFSQNPSGMEMMAGYQDSPSMDPFSSTSYGGGGGGLNSSAEVFSRPSCEYDSSMANSTAAAATATRMMMSTISPSQYPASTEMNGSISSGDSNHVPAPASPYFFYSHPQMNTSGPPPHHHHHSHAYHPHNNHEQYETHYTDNPLNGVVSSLEYHHHHNQPLPPPPPPRYSCLAVPKPYGEGEREGGVDETELDEAARHRRHGIGTDLSRDYERDAARIRSSMTSIMSNDHGDDHYHRGDATNEGVGGGGGGAVTFHRVGGNMSPPPHSVSLPQSQVLYGNYYNQNEHQPNLTNNCTIEANAHHQQQHPQQQLQPQVRSPQSMSSIASSTSSNASSPRPAPHAATATPLHPILHSPFQANIPIPIMTTVANEAAHHHQQQHQHHVHHLNTSSPLVTGTEMTECEARYQISPPVLATAPARQLSLPLPVSYNLNSNYDLMGGMGGAAVVVVTEAGVEVQNDETRGDEGRTSVIKSNLYNPMSQKMNNIINSSKHTNYNHHQTTSSTM